MNMILDFAGRTVTHLLLTTLWQSAVIAVVSLPVLWLLRRHRAQVRYLVLLTGLVLMLALPLLTVTPVGGWLELVSWGQADNADTAPVQRLYSLDTMEHVADVRIIPSSGTGRAWYKRESTWLVILALYAFGVTLMLMQTLYNWLKVHRWIRRARTVSSEQVMQVFDAARDQLGLRRVIPILSHSNVTVPMAVGWRQARVLLPANVVDQADPDKLATVALHELGHICRNDARVFMLLGWVRPFLFFNPFFHLFRRWLGTQAEYACDEFVLQSGADPVAYAKTLLSYARVRPCGGRPDFAPGLFTRSEVLSRIHRTLRFGRTPMRTWTHTTAIVFGISVVITGALIIGLPLLEKPVLAAPDGDKEGKVPEEVLVVPNVDESIACITHFPLKKDLDQRISLGYGPCKDPFTGEAVFHKAIDLPAEAGTPVLAAGAGKVIKVKTEDEGRGNFVVILHEGDYMTHYTHLQGFNVELNQQVNPGDVIGYVGSTGKSTGPHLHFAVSRGTEYINPMTVAAIHDHMMKIKQIRAEQQGMRQPSETKAQDSVFVIYSTQTRD